MWPWNGREKYWRIKIEAGLWRCGCDSGRMREYLNHVHKGVGEGKHIRKMITAGGTIGGAPKAQYVILSVHPRYVSAIHLDA